MTPLRNYVLFKPFPSDEVTIGGIIVADVAKEINNKGVIVKAGNGTLDRPMKLKEGDIVYRVKNLGVPTEIDGELFFLMEDSAIIAKD